MDIVPDSNIFTSDPWFRSQQWRLLFDFTRKRLAQVILLEPVEMEIRANFRRKAEEAVNKIEAAIRSADRLGLAIEHGFDAAENVKRIVAEWNRNFEKVIETEKIVRVQLEPSILREAVWRATERIPPCDEHGKQLRDTIIWLSFIESCKRRQHGDKNVFITNNKTDFADHKDETLLRKQLLDDVTVNGLKVLYYPKLDSFNKEHAEKIEHINLAWVRERLDLNEVSESMRKWLALHEEYFRLDAAHRNYYKPRRVLEITSLDIELTDQVYVWEIAEGQYELSVGIGVSAEAIIDCEYTGERGDFFWGDSFFGESYFTPSDESLDGYAELSGTIAVALSGDLLQFIGIEKLGSI